MNAYNFREYSHVEKTIFAQANSSEAKPQAIIRQVAIEEMGHSIAKRLRYRVLFGSPT